LGIPFGLHEGVAVRLEAEPMDPKPYWEAQVWRRFLREECGGMAWVMPMFIEEVGFV
jgi:hypothetical protein